MKFDWPLLKALSKPGQVTTLTLVSENSREGKLLAAGRGQIPGDKVVDDRTAADLLAAFERQGFDRFAVRAAPDAGPAGALNAIWLDRGEGVESLFLMPGALNSPETRDLPKVYEGLKALIVTVHQRTMGATVTTGQGWSGDDMMKQRPGGAGK